MIAVLGALLIPLAGCDALSTTASCEEYVAEFESPGNPMWALSLDSACGSDPSMTIGEYFAQGSE